MPRYLCPQKNVDKGKEYWSFSQMCAYTNLKADLAGAGRGGTCYPEFQHFTVQEIKQFMGFYIINGLSPSPRIEMKLKSQREDWLNGNDFINQSFRGKSGTVEQRHWHFKAFLAMQNPRMEPPARKKTNWKYCCC